MPKRTCSVSSPLSNHHVTKHANERMTGRDIPPGVVDLIIDYGEAAEARGGVVKVALSKRSFRDLRKHYGRNLAKEMARYRRAYVVLRTDAILTVAFANQPLFF